MIMIILAAAYAAMSAVEPPCRVPGADEAGKTSAALRSWFADARERIARGHSYLERACPANSPAAGTMKPLEMSPLRGVCAKQADAIMADAGLTTEAVAGILSDEALIDAALARCPIPEARCEAATADRISALARELRVWWTAERNDLAETERFLDDACKGWSEGPDAPPGGARPARLARRAMSADATRVVTDAGLDDEALRALSRDRARAALALKRCIPKQESITVSEGQLKFEQCSAEINRGADFFAEKAKEIEAAVQRGKYNRVDIFGHSDSRTFKSCLVKVHWDGYSDSDFVIHDNVTLSLLRADAFLGYLRAAIRGRPDLKDLEARLEDRSLRFYAIGVGSAEPKATDDESRRIEIRLVNDHRSPG